MKKFVVLAVFAFLAISMISLALAEENETAVNSNESAALTNNSDLNASANESDNSNRLVISPGINRTKIVVVTGTKSLPHPAALFCEKLGYNAVTRTDSTGKAYEVCVFPDGKECMQIEFMREKCGREYLNGTAKTIRKELKKEVKERIKERNCEEDCMINIEDKNITIRDLSAEKREIIAEKINARTGLNLSADDIDNRTMLRAYLSNGRWALVKQMPNIASEKALERMKAKCAETGCSIELKEVGVDNKTRLVYVVKAEKDSRVFLLFNKKMPLVAQVDAETGEVVAVKRPWWAFLAKETNEETESANETVSLAVNETGSLTVSTTNITNTTADETVSLTANETVSLTANDTVNQTVNTTANTTA
jgi:putative hemolysin